jgi:Ca2+/Na+ antiporter
VQAGNVGMQFRNAILSTAAVEIGMIGYESKTLCTSDNRRCLGAAGFGSLFASSLFDVTLILPSSVALAGLAIVPYVFIINYYYYIIIMIELLHFEYRKYWLTLD